MQIMKLTDRMNKLSKDLSSEKTTSEKHQKSTTDLLAQQTSENRKLLLELSKLKVSGYAHTSIMITTSLIAYC